MLSSPIGASRPLSPEEAWLLKADYGDLNREIEKNPEDFALRAAQIILSSRQSKLELDYYKNKVANRLAAQLHIVPLQIFLNTVSPPKSPGFSKADRVELEFYRKDGQTLTTVQLLEYIKRMSDDEFGTKAQTLLEVLCMRGSKTDLPTDHLIIKEYGNLPLEAAILQRCRENRIRINLSRALYVACTYSREKQVEFLLDNRVSPKAKHNEILISTIQARHCSNPVDALHAPVIAELLLKKDPTIVDGVDTIGNTPLHFASFLGALDAIVLLCNYNAKKDAKNDKGETSLLVVSKTDHTDAVRLLVQNGANANIADNNGSTPLHVACSYGRLETVKVLCEAAKAKPDIIDSNGNTPLHIACSNGHLKAVKVLCEVAKAKADIANKDKNTPLHIACSNGHLDAVRVLCETVNANPNIVDGNGKTALHIACENDCLEIVRVLCLAGANIKAKDSSGRTPLDIAQKKGLGPIVTFLVDRKPKSAWT